MHRKIAVQTRFLTSSAPDGLTKSSACSFILSCCLLLFLPTSLHPCLRSAELPDTKPRSHVLLYRQLRRLVCPGLEKKSTILCCLACFAPCSFYPRHSIPVCGPSSSPSPNPRHRLTCIASYVTFGRLRIKKQVYSTQRED